MKFFNTAGPVNQVEHYKLDPLTRWDLDEILFLINQKKYFILHAPRQTGKTSCLLALREYLNIRDDYHCIYANFEAGQSARNDVEKGIEYILLELHKRVEILFGKSTETAQLMPASMKNGLNIYLANLAAYSDKPLVLVIDEIDALVGDTLIAVLRQLRSGYDTRPEQFPQSIILCGVRDIKDYRIHRSDGEIITGGSCFNIKSKSLSLGNFSEAEVKQLYNEHTQTTGQQFDEAVFPLVMRFTGGQPWLVNALAYEAVWEMKANRDPKVLITAEIIEIAKERLILSRATHLDQLADKLQEPRVRRVIEAMLLGENPTVTARDVEYCLDLGLICRQPEGLMIANDIYREVMPRELTESVQTAFLSQFTPAWVKNDGSLDNDRLMKMFQQFWCENSDIWAVDIAGYVESAPHLVFMGFLQRVANGSGTVYREYGLGRGRVDLMLKWQAPTGEQRIVIELKMRTERHATPAAFAKLKADGIKQTIEYAENCQATAVNLVIFDRRKNISWDERISCETITINNRQLHIWGM